MVWIGVLLGIGLILWAIRTDGEAFSGAQQYLGETKAIRFVSLIAAGALIIIVSIAISYGRASFWRRAPHSKIEIPARVLNAIEEAVDSGYLSKEQAAEVNEWLNYDVRIQPREIEVIEIDHKVTIPVDIVMRVAEKKELVADDKDQLVKYLANLVAQHSEEDIVHLGGTVALCEVLITGAVSDKQADALRQLAESATRIYGLSPVDYGIPVKPPNDEGRPGGPDSVPMPPVP